MEKTFWQILKGTLKGSDGEGSAKRISTAHFMMLLTALTISYIVEFHFSARSATPTNIQITIVGMFTTIIYAFLITIWLLLGLATIEWITYLVRSIKGEPAQAPTNSSTNTSSSPNQ